MINVHAEIKRLNGLTVSHLQGEYTRLWGEPTRSHNRVYLIKRIVWRAQALGQGDLTERARHLAGSLARDEDLRVRPRPEVHAAFALAGSVQAPPPDMPAPGTVLCRRYKGRTIEVKVLAQGFQYDGKEYGSLSAVAKAITGSEWNGPLFFGLTKRGGAA